MTSGRMLKARREYLYKVLSESHREHQADKPGDTDENCGVCKINNRTLGKELNEKIQKAKRL
jgi:hypothetical protein